MAILKSDVNRRGVSQAAFMAALLVIALVWPLAAARPAAAQDPVQTPVRVGGALLPPMKIKDVRPVYPESAKAEGRSGVVIIEALIAADGTVDNAKVVRPIGEDLDNAALDAVLQWMFTPTKLNGVAVPVIMTVTVQFSLDTGVPPPPPPPPPPPTDPVVRDFVTPPPPPPMLVNGEQPLRIGGDIAPPTKIKDVRPVYPEIAQQARVSGIVIIEAVIDQEGNVVSARVIRPVALLDEAARDAVLQWKFTPTQLNGVAVPVIMTVTVNFSLQ